MSRSDARRAAKLRVLVIEDEGMVAMMIEDMLIDMGHDVVAVVSRMDEAVQVARYSAFDFAVLDVNLDGLASYPVAEILLSRGIRFAFATGYGTNGRDPKYANVPTLAKPFVDKDLAKVLAQFA
jgi:CheY-like chemotaxis protein